MVDLSILICSHNRSKLLRRGLESLSQIKLPEGKSLELVIVANACTDDTEKVVASARRAIPFPIHYVVEHRVGISFARNRAVGCASGEIIAFLDDDVLVESDWAEEIFQAYADHAADLVGGHVGLLWEAERPSWWRSADYDWIVSACDCGDDSFQMHNPTGLIGANFSFHRGVYEKIGGFRCDLGRMHRSLLAGEETNFTERAIAAGFKAIHCPTVGVRHWVPRSRATPEYLARAAAGVARGDMIMRRTFGPRAATRSLCGYLYKFARDSIAFGVAVACQNESAAVQYRVRASAHAGSFLGGIQRLGLGLSPKVNPAPPETASSKPGSSPSLSLRSQSPHSS